MISRDAEPIAHTPPLKRIDNVPAPEPIPPVNALELMVENALETRRQSEAVRIWALVRQSAGDAVPEVHPGAIAATPAHASPHYPKVGEVFGDWVFDGRNWVSAWHPVNARFQWEPYVRAWVTQDDIDAVSDSPIWTQEDFDEAVPFGDMCWVTG